MISGEDQCIFREIFSPVYIGILKVDNKGKLIKFDAGLNIV